MLRLEAVGKRFRERAVLNGVSLEVAAGEMVAVLGESGVGKSTLLNVIAGLEPIDSGRISFLGQDYAGLDDDALALLRREHFGFVFQAFHVLPYLTVEQNAGLPLLLRRMDRADIAQRARAALADVGLAGRESDPPHELSGGELQRVAIARALAGSPRLVLADEPTGNLDPTNARQVMDLFAAQVRARGAAAIVVTHSEAVAAACGRRLRLSAEGLREAP